MLLMEYGGTRLWGLFKRKKLEEHEIKELLTQILQGLKEIHDNGYLHRDLSPENILVTKYNQIKIVDFGFTKDGRGRQTKLGNIVYMAPEITGDTQYNHKADIWSLGIITYEMVHQDIPFSTRKNFKEDRFIENRNRLELEFSPNISADLEDFIRKMIVLNPEKRASTDELLNHPFIRGHNNSQE